MTYDFEEIKRKNAEKEARLKKEREEANRRTKREYRLRPKEKPKEPTPIERLQSIKQSLTKIDDIMKRLSERGEKNNDDSASRKDSDKTD